MDDAEMKAREIIELVESTTFGPGSNLQHAMKSALREAEARGMMRAAGIVWDDLPEMARKYLGKRGKDEKALRLQIRDEIIEQAAAAPTEEPPATSSSASGETSTR